MKASYTIVHIYIMWKWTTQPVCSRYKAMTRKVFRLSADVQPNRFGNCQLCEGGQFPPEMFQFVCIYIKTCTNTNVKEFHDPPLQAPTRNKILAMPLTATEQSDSLSTNTACTNDYTMCALESEALQWWRSGNKKSSARDDEHSINLAHSVHTADMLLLQYILVTKIVLHKITNKCKSGTTMSSWVKPSRYNTYEHNNLHIILYNLQEISK